MKPLGKQTKLLRRLALLAGAVGAFVVGYALRGPVPSGHGAQAGVAGHAHGSPAGKKAETWTCSMHPEIRMPGPGMCPKCPMKLIRVEGDGGGSGRVLKLGEHARRLAEIAVTRVERKALKSELRLVGKVAYDETRVGTITAWVAGRIDKLYVDFTGVTVKRYQPLAYLYSPELVTAQMELLQATRLAGSLKRAGVGGTSTLRAARDKLRLMGLSSKQLAAVIKRGRPLDHLTIYARRRGVVVKKHVQVGMYVKAGSRLFTVADLRKVWVLLDVYESDLHRVRKGQTVTFTARAYPGERFTGTVAFVDPFVSDRTRTLRVRVEVENPQRRLKPDMLISAVLDSKVNGEPLVIPSNAPLITGKRAVVYVEKKRGTYEGRVVELGPRVGEYYVVRRGLKEGEKVVTRGAFKLDSELQIRARPSMMNPPPAIPAAFRRELDGVMAAYFAMHKPLSKDQVAPAQKSGRKLLTAIGAVQTTLLTGNQKRLWDQHAKGLRSHTEALVKAADLKTARKQFDGVSQVVIKIVRRFGTSGKTAVKRYHCSMAFNNRGAYWLQPNKGVENPYFGSEMYRCGEEVETLTAGSSKR